MFRSKSAGIMDTVAKTMETEWSLRRRQRRVRHDVLPERTPPEILVQRETSYAIARTLGLNR